MGGSSWSDDHYRDRAADRARRGVKTFAYHDDISSGRTAAKVHDKLDPKGVTRESCDSEAHPESVAIGVMFDETGSMGNVPRTMQEKLPQLMNLIIRKGYMEHPQILFGGVGDVFSDRAPLQVGQFESGAEMDDDITNIYLEGNGGGSYEESYNLAMYFFANHTEIDCLKKRGKKGYLFLIGDEMPYATTTAREIEQIIGDTVQGDIKIEDIVATVQEKYNLFFIVPTEGTQHGHDPRLFQRWEDLIGKQNVLRLKVNESVCETIALAIGICEGTVDLPAAEKDLRDAGTAIAVAESATTAVSDLASKHALAKVGSGDLPEGDSLAKRL